MSIKIAPGQRFRIAKLFHKDKITNAYGSTSRKKSKDDTNYLYSNWNLTFVGKANAKALEEVKEGSVVEIVSAISTKEPYMKDGEKVYPKSEQIIIFDFTVYQAKGAKPSARPHEEEEHPDEPQVPADDDIPF